MIKSQDQQRMIEVLNNNFIGQSQFKIEFDGDKIILKERTGYNKISLSVSQDALPVKFKHIDGHFECNSAGLVTLRGAPEFCYGFECNNNKLLDLQGGPTSVWSSYECSNNRLKTLLGAPTQVGYDFDCSNNALTSLRYCPVNIKGGIKCQHNLLQTLEGAPRELSWFDCDSNELSNLIGAPEICTSYFSAMRNPLTSLEGLPKYISNTLYLPYHDKLPLLRVLTVKGLQSLVLRSNDAFTSNKVETILRKYIGQGTRGILSCAIELIKAGFRSNAKL